jgi:hypothetical protein
MVRLDYDDRLGPAREVQAGSGFWSQNASVQVLGAATAATGIQVRWPGGKIARGKLPPSAREIEVSTDGTVQVLR